jgi:AcrR family transcriptional regulator
VIIFRISLTNMKLSDASTRSRRRAEQGTNETSGSNEQTTRPYHMTARAAAARATGEAILDAACAAFGRERFDRVMLNEIAAESGVTVQTVIRRFGSKEDLFEAVARREGARISAARTTDVDADLETALSTLLDHYEEDGDLVLHLVAQEQDCEPVREVVLWGRRIHREWVERHCRSLFIETGGAERERKIHAAIAATDLSTWKLLRRDLGLELTDVAATMKQLLDGLAEDN